MLISINYKKKKNKISVYKKGKVNLMNFYKKGSCVPIYTYGKIFLGN
jgi:hypothetical protein